MIEALIKKSYIKRTCVVPEIERITERRKIFFSVNGKVGIK